MKKVKIQKPDSKEISKEMKKRKEKRVERLSVISKSLNLISFSLGFEAEFLIHV